MTFLNLLISIKDKKNKNRPFHNYSLYIMFRGIHISGTPKYKRK